MLFESTKRFCLGFGLRFSTALSPPVLGHCRDDGVKALGQIPTLLRYPPVNVLSETRIKKSYGAHVQQYHGGSQH